ncbi:MAG: S8 family serine peptidase [Bacteroidetes bacterium]|nr:S8 family serine peptidase [Bacteroidota bacterium]
MENNNAVERINGTIVRSKQLSFNPFYFCLLFMFIVFNSFVIGQTAPTKFWVQFTDKIGTPYSISNPSAFLSAKAIERRLKQNIAIAENDLPVNPSYVTGVVSQDSITLLHKSKWFNAITIQTTDTLAIQAIGNLSYVKNISPVSIFKGIPEDQPIEANFKTTEEYSVGNYSYGSSYNQVNMIGTDCMHEKGYTGKGLLIAVLDAGFLLANTNPCFDSLRAHNAIIGTWDFVTNDSMVYEDDSHGTYVLSTMGGHIPGQLVGTAPDATYLLLRTEDAPSEYIIEEDNWVAGAEYADSVGADIINSSLGYTQFDDASQNHVYADLDGNTTRITIGADIAASKGILVVNSAGNSGSSSWFYIGAPADGDSVLAIGAVNANQQYASFSSKGPSADGRIKPNVAAKGQAATVTNFSNGISSANGTSFSSPIIAGAAASLWQANPNATNMQIFKAIEQSATNYDNPDNLTGYGIPNFCIANELLHGKSREDFLENNILTIHPNPFTTEINFIFYSDKEQSLTTNLYDARGRLINTTSTACLSNRPYYQTIDNLFNLSEGIYILEVRTESFKEVYKLIKN